MTRDPIRAVPPLAAALLPALAGLLLGARARSRSRRLSAPAPTVAGMRGGAVVVETALFEVDELEPAPAEPVAPPAWADALGVFDLETTGVDTATARIVTAHVGVIDETGQVVERKDWIVDPGVEIPEAASAIHGIDTARARRFGRAPQHVVPEIVAAIRSVFDRGLPLVVYNAPYDLTLLAAEARRVGAEPLGEDGVVVDPLVLDKAVDRYRRGKRTLEVTAGHYGVPLNDAHDAGADAIAAGRVAQAIAARYPAELGLAPSALHAAQVDWCADQSARFQAYMREKRDPEFIANGSWPLR